MRGFILIALITVQLLDKRSGAFLHLNSEDLLVDEERIQAVALQGEEARLSCPLLKGGKLYTVLWYKDTLGEPFYTFDGRSKHEVWSDVPPRGFGARAFIRITNSSATLFISSIKISEAAVYRCRVDYKHEQTQNHFIQLSVPVPPTSLALYLHEEQRSITEYTVLQPVKENTPYSASCTTNTGNPLPRLVWFIGEDIVDDSYQEQDGAVFNHLTVPHLPREWAGRNLTCQASNNNISTPLTLPILLNMFTYPVFIKLTGPEGEMSDGNNYSFQCESEGSNPPADLEWFLKGKKIPNPQVLKSGNSSSSNLSIIADYRLDGENVSCIVFNKELKHKKLISNHTLSVQYSPILKLTMGANLNSNKIIQGTDVFFQCSILSKPKEYKVEWYMNDERVEENISAGIIITDSSLVIQKVGLMAGGEYGCRASNIQGDGYSNKIHLNILYAPRCSRSKGSHLVPIRSRRNLTCIVESNPQPSSYYWSINTTGQGFKLLNQTEGFLDLSTIETEGILECFAINSIGEMQKPCSWTAVEIGIPDPPTQCKILNQSVSWMDISCNPAWDGGLDQVFHLEVYNSSPFTLIRNISNTGAPAFTVKRLEPAQHLTMTIYSSNAKGRSSVIEIESSTSKLAAAVLSDGVEEADRAEVPLGIILGVTSTLLIIIIIILLLILARRHRGESMPSDEEMEIRLSTNLLEKSRETPILTSSSLLSKPNQLERQGQKNAGKPRLLDSTEPEPGISDGRFLRSCTGTPDSQYLLHGDEYTNNEAFKEDDYKIYSPDEDTDTFSDFERKQFKGKILNPSVRNINIKINPNYM